MVIHLSYETLLVSTEGNCTTITLNRPQSMNALNETLLQELAHCLNVVSRDDSQQIVVLRGNNGVFSAGGDIKDMLLKESTEEEFSAIMSAITDIVVTLYTMPKLTVSLVEGAAAGLGLSLALATDRLVATPSTVLAMNFIGIGLIPDGGGHYFLAERLGPKKAQEMIWAGDKLTAQEAKEVGLVHEVVESVEEYLGATLKEWRRKPLLAMIKTKMIYASMNRDELLRVLQMEKQGQWKMRLTDDHKEGVDAFLMKRYPKFEGK